MFHASPIFFVCSLLSQTAKKLIASSEESFPIELSHTQSSSLNTVESIWIFQGLECVPDIFTSEVLKLSNFVIFTEGNIGMLVSAITSDCIATISTYDQLKILLLYLAIKFFKIH
jgi:hypothetical protein